MNGDLGRDKLWNQQIWSDIDNAVREEVGRIRVAQKVFPTTVVNNVLPISMNKVVPSPEPGDDEFAPFIEMSVEFALSQAQVDAEESMRLARAFARRAASAIAAAEDAILFLGNSIVSAVHPYVVAGTGVTITNRGGIPPGFVAEAHKYALIPVPGAAPFPGNLGNILAAVADGIAALNYRAQPGPHALFLPPGRYAQTFEPPGGQLLAPGDQINHVVTGGFYMVNSLVRVQPPPPPDIGILVSLGGEPAKIILGTDTVTAFTHIGVQGSYHFRVFERIQLVVQDERAFQILSIP